MKTTIEIADAVFRRMKATAALKGQSLRVFLDEAIRDKLAADRRVGARASGWRAVFGKGDKRRLAEVQTAIDAEFSRVRPEDWQ